MTISGNDIVYVLSGGSTNTDPTKSLGGYPSSQFILGTTDNLFDDISAGEAASGYTDYRCFYIFNDNAIDTLYGSQLYIVSQVPGGSVLSVGLTVGNDTQVINIVGTITNSGTYSVQYESYTPVTVAYSPDAAVWGENLQTELRTIPGLSDITVQVGVFSNAVAFQVNFVGSASNRNQPLLQITSYTLTGINLGFSVIKTVEGGPINYIASTIDVATTPPTGVVFNTPSKASPALVGDLLPTDGIAVWVQRVTPLAAAPLPNDGFTIRLAGFSSPD